MRAATQTRRVLALLSSAFMHITLLGWQWEACNPLGQHIIKIILFSTPQLFGILFNQEASSELLLVLWEAEIQESHLAKNLFPAWDGAAIQPTQQPESVSQALWASTGSLWMQIPESTCSAGGIPTPHWWKLVLSENSWKWSSKSKFGHAEPSDSAAKDTRCGLQLTAILASNLPMGWQVSVQGTWGDTGCRGEANDCSEM